MPKTKCDGHWWHLSVNAALFTLYFFWNYSDICAKACQLALETPNSSLSVWLSLLPSFHSLLFFFVCPLVLLIHTFCLLHSCHILFIFSSCLSLSFCNSLMKFFFTSFLDTGIPPPSLIFCLPVSCSLLCLFLTYDLVILLTFLCWLISLVSCLLTHIWYGAEVPAEQELQLRMLCLCVGDNCHDCQRVEQEVGDKCFHTLSCDVQVPVWFNCLDYILFYLTPFV